MLSKSKLKKMRGQFKRLNVTMQEVANYCGISRKYVYEIIDGKYYNGDVVRKMIALRKSKLQEVQQLEERL